MQLINLNTVLRSGYRDNVFGIVTVVHARPRLALEHTHPSILWVPGVKPSRREADRSSPSSAEASEWTLPSVPPPIRLHGMHRNKFLRLYF